ncbi:hypothetical protein LWS69_28795, partial [Bordetella hinzii]|nr:hypothetical protein [Bordetella hinzii]
MVSLCEVKRDSGIIGPAALAVHIPSHWSYQFVRCRIGGKKIFMVLFQLLERIWSPCPEAGGNWSYQWEICRWMRPASG